MTFQIENVEETAIENLDEKYAGILAKRLLGLGVKGAIAYGIGRETKNPALGLLAGYLLTETDRQRMCALGIYSQRTFRCFEPPFPLEPTPFS